MKYELRLKPNWHMSKGPLKLPSLAQNRPYLRSAYTKGPYVPLNGFDATKQHFYATYAKWERVRSLLMGESLELYHLGRMLVDEAEACHKWVGQNGKRTMDGFHGRMENYDEFKEAVEMIRDFIGNGNRTDERFRRSSRRWINEFVTLRKDWNEEEKDPGDDEDEEEDVEEDDEESEEELEEELGEETGENEQSDENSEESDEGSE